MLSGLLDFITEVRDVPANQVLHALRMARNMRCSSHQRKLKVCSRVLTVFRNAVYCTSTEFSMSLSTLLERP